MSLNPREAVSNTVRHAHATALTVMVTAAADLVIEVTDNGTGIPGTSPAAACTT